MLFLLIALLSSPGLIAANYYSVIDCSGCGRFQRTDNECVLNGESGVGYKRDINQAYCDEDICPEYVCDTSLNSMCSGNVSYKMCNEECEEQSLVFVSMEDECVVTVLKKACVGGRCPTDLNLYSPARALLPSPLETLSCSNCGPWRWIGWCNREGQPPGRFNWRWTDSRYPDCNKEKCNEFACDPTPIHSTIPGDKCNGTYVEELCGDDCRQKYRAWSKDSSGNCVDDVVYYPCYTHPHCWEEETAPAQLQHLRNQDDAHLIDYVFTPGNVQLLRKQSEEENSGFHGYQLLRSEGKEDPLSKDQINPDSIQLLRKKSDSDLTKPHSQGWKPSDD